MTAVRKFLFDTSFDGGPAAGPPAGTTAAPPAPKPSAEAAHAPAPAPSITEADLERARQEGEAAGYAAGEAAGRGAGFEEGRAAGRTEAQQAGAHLAAEALAAIERSVAALFARHAEADAAAERLALSVARAALARVYPAVAARHGLEEIEALLSDCLARLGEEPRVVVRVADGLYDALDEKLSGLAQRTGFEGKVVLLSEPDFAPGDLRVEWADGGAERDGAAIAAELDAILERALAARRGTAAEAAEAMPPAAPADATATTEDSPAAGAAAPAGSHAEG